ALHAGVLLEAADEILGGLAPGGGVALHALIRLLRIVDALLLRGLLRGVARERLEGLRVLLLLPFPELVAGLGRGVAVLALGSADVAVGRGALRPLRRGGRGGGRDDSDQRTDRQHLDESHRSTPPCRGSSAAHDTTAARALKDAAVRFIDSRRARHRAR